MSSSLQIITLDIQNEMDIMLAHRRAMQFAKFSGIMLAEQTRFATAVSEICRNTLEYARGGEIAFSIKKGTGTYCLEAVIKDKGNGIKNLDEIFSRKPETHRGRGVGIVYAKRLADAFEIKTSSKGTTVLLQKNIPSKFDLFTKLIIDGWIKHIRQEPTISAYEELKIRNSQLLELTEEMRANSKVVEKQMLEIRQLNKQLSDNNERMKEFTYAISHDLKNPLSSLKIAAGQLRNKPSEEESELYLGVLKRSMGRLEKTIYGLIEILDIQNQDKHVMRELDLARLFAEAEEEFGPMIKDYKAKVQKDFEIAPRITYVEGYLVSLFHNMLSNSLKYRQPDKKLEISVSSKLAGDFVQIQFKDNGMGMDLEKIGGKLFMPFNRFSDVAEGKGIGLYLIKGMIENNGGNVQVSSEINQGTTFTFNLLPYV